MDIYKIISDVLVLLIPALSMFIVWGFRQAKQRLPEKQAQALNQFVGIATKCIEQTSTGTSTQKKNAAIELIYSFFESIGLPAPSHVLIDAALEACVYEINLHKIPDEFFDGDKRAVNTGPIKPVLPPDAGGQPV